ncbi:MAG: class I SAM-dependent methyltransferase [Deltaproteobacteria bacterium]|nr:class I SAM-dependent methyltransferase [Deltaproteobacteria bacterium]
MYGRYHFHLHHNPFKRLVYGVLGGPRISDWIRFWNVRRVLKRLNVSGALQVLDAGCGQGFYSIMLAESFPAAAITAVDEDPTLIKRLQKMARAMGLRLISTSTADLGGYIPKNKFNLICCVDVMEHIIDHDAVFCNIASWLAPGGTLILHVPQKNQKFMFLKRSHGGDDPHCREGYDLPELKAKLELQGLKLIFYKHTFGRLAGMAVELDEILWESHLYPVWLLFYPLFLSIAVWDIDHQWKQGQGIIIAAQSNV